MIKDLRLPINSKNELRDPKKIRAATGVEYLECNLPNKEGRWCFLAAAYTKRDVVNVIALTTPMHEAATQTA